MTRNQILNSSLQNPKELFEHLVSQITVYDKQEAREIVFWLLEHELGLAKIDVLTKHSLPEKAIDWQSLINRLNQNEPIQYILGETEFYGRRFLVNPSVLIPRPETEELIALVLKKVRYEIRDTRYEILNLKSKILDIGTGSGCIAISLAKELPESEVFAWDISESAVETAQKNAILNDAKINFEQKDVLAVSGQDLAVPKFDIIVSNPPYITQKEAQKMQENVLNFEPHLALFVEDCEPLVFYEAIAKLAINTLIINGLVVVEINENYGKETAEVFEKYNFSEIEIIKDINQKDRFVKATKIN